jgi:hypothetical protein
MRMHPIAAAAIFCAAAASFGSPVSDFIKNADHLRIGDAKSADNAAFEIGHLKLAFTSGAIAPVFAGSDAVGFFFKGKGSLTYETTETAELPVVAHNVRAIAHVKITTDATHAVITDDFDTLLVVAGGIALPQLTAAGSAPVSDAFNQHEETFSRFWVAPRSHELAIQKFSFPSARFLRAEFSGGRDKLLYEYDDVEDHNEELATVHGPRADVGDKRIDQRLYPGLLSLQPIGHDKSVTPPPPFALTRLDYALTADGDNAKLDVTETIARLNPAEQALRFRMRDEVIVKLNVAARSFNVRSVTDEQGHPLPFDHQKGDLVVDVSGLAAQPLTLKFSIDGDFLVRAGGDNAWQLPLGGAWYPEPRQWAGNAFTVHSVVKVKKPFVPIVPGDTIGRREEGDYNVVENAIGKPVQFTTVVGGKYNLFEEKQGDLTIRVWTYAMRNDRAAKQLTDLAFGLIDYYQFFLGPFPFSEFNIVQMNEYGYGQAPPATMFITNEAFSRVTDTDKFFSQGINERFAHEIAHQYWAYVVRMPSEEEQWLSESFAEYSAALALKKLQNEAAYQHLVAVWRGRARDGASVAPIPYANRIEGEPSNTFAERTALLYNKGPLLLYALNKELGDTAFLTFLKSYTRSFNFKFGSTRDAAGLLKFMTKKDYQPFFDKYFWGTATPD